MKAKINKKLIQESLMAKAKTAGAIGAGIGGLGLIHHFNDDKLSDNLSNNFSKMRDNSEAHLDIISADHFDFKG